MDFNKKNFSFTTSILAVVIGLFLIYKFGTVGEKKIVLTSGEEIEVPQKYKKSKTLLAKSFEGKVTVVEDNDISKSCKGYWDEIVSGTIEQVSQDLMDGSIVKSEKCSKLEDGVFDKNVLTAIKDLCSKENMKKFGSDSLKTRKIEEMCMSYLMFYRAIVIDHVTGDTKDPFDYDSSVLLNKIVAKTVLSAKSKESVKRAMALSDALIEKEPYLYAGYKSKAVLLILDKVMNNNDIPGEVFDGVIDNIEALDPQDPQMFEVLFSKYMFSKQYDSILFLADDMEKNEPKNGLGNYFSALYFWKNGKRDDTVSQLKKAVAKEPESERFKTALEKVKTAPIKQKGIFSAQFGFNLTDI